MPHNIYYCRNNHQVFVALGALFCINYAEEIITKKPRESVMLDIISLDKYIKWFSVNKEYIERMDISVLNKPIILATIRDDSGEYVFPIDGWHRINKAFKLGIKELPAHVLNVRETKKIRLV